MKSKQSLVDEYVANPTNASQFLAAANEHLRAELAEKIDRLLDEAEEDIPCSAPGTLHSAGYQDAIEDLRPRLRALVLGENVDKPPQDWALSAGDCNDE